MLNNVFTLAYQKHSLQTHLKFPFCVQNAFCGKMAFALMWIYSVLIMTRIFSDSEGGSSAYSDKVKYSLIISIT